jgi:glyoxylase-like metal-dependent hydrolase (beta-lactamase superfamily II)
MADDLVFDRSSDGAYGTAVTLSPLVRRVLARNPGPLTFTGTATHIVGRGTVAVVDPGPDDGSHLDALCAALAGERVAAILVTHTHRDHTGAVAALAAATGAPVIGCAPPAQTPAGVEGAGDAAYRPDRVLRDGEIIAGPNWTVTAVATPGHTANHLCFALAEESALFSGDHVMAWSTTVVAPPDGAMADYRASLAKLLARTEERYYPAHGPAKDGARAWVAALLRHRELREREILARVAAGDRTVSEIVAAIYPGIDPALAGAAAASVRAHLEDLAARGLATGADGRLASA